MTRLVEYLRHYQPVTTAYLMVMVTLILITLLLDLKLPGAGCN